MMLPEQEQGQRRSHNTPVRQKKRGGPGERSTCIRMTGGIAAFHQCNCGLSGAARRMSVWALAEVCARSLLASVGL